MKCLARMALALPLLVAAAPGPPATVLEVRAQVLPGLDGFRALDEMHGAIVSVAVAESPTPYQCRLVLRDGVLCRGWAIPADARDLQLSVAAPGYQRAVRTVPRLRREAARLVARLEAIHLRVADVTAAPVVLTDGPGTRRFQLSLTNRSGESVDVSRITLHALGPTAICAAQEPVAVFQLESTLYVRQDAGGRWAVEAAARDPVNAGERLRVTGELVDDPCSRDRLVLAIPSRMAIPPGRQASVDLLLPDRFTVQGRAVAGGAAANPAARARVAAFDGTIGRFGLYVVTFRTSSRSSPDVVTFIEQ